MSIETQCTLNNNFVYDATEPWYRMGCVLINGPGSVPYSCEKKHNLALSYRLQNNQLWTSSLKFKR